MKYLKKFESNNVGFSENQLRESSLDLLEYFVDFDDLWGADVISNGLKSYNIYQEHDLRNIDKIGRLHLMIKMDDWPKDLDLSSFVQKFHHSINMSESMGGFSLLPLDYYSDHIFLVSIGGIGDDYRSRFNSYFSSYFSRSSFNESTILKKFRNQLHRFRDKADRESFPIIRSIVCNFRPPFL